MQFSKSSLRPMAVLLLLSGCAFEGAGDEEEVSTSTAALTQNGLSATIAYSSDWGSGYCVSVNLENVGTTPITTWEVQTDLRQSTVTSGWNATFTTSGGRYVATPLGTNGSIGIGGKSSYGFCANAPSTSARPVITAVSANGSSGTGGASGSGGSASGGAASGGTASGGAASGGSSCTSIYEAENITKSGGYAIAGGWNLNSNGTLSTTHSFSSGSHRITVAAKGDQANGAPRMRVSVGGQNLGEVDVPATAWTNYSFTYNAASAGSRAIEVAFTNDYYSGGLDRNLHVDKLTVACDAGSGSGGSSGSGGTSGTGGATGSGGGSGGSASCSLPSSFRWTSSGSLAEPKSPTGKQWVSMKDFTVTRYNSNYLVYATVWNDVPTGQAEQGWQGVFLQFSDFGKMKDATQISKPGMVAPHLFYFSPKNTWVLAYQWGFKYATSSTPNVPSSWSATTNLLGNNPTVGDPAGTGPIDLSLICDDANCYLFFAGDNGVIYRGSMPKGNFPGTFTNSAAILRDSQTALYEGVEVYKIKGQNKYLMIVEAAGNAAQPWGARFFRAFTADSLGGAWTAMPNASSREKPFAGLNNVTFPGGKWTDDISHGDLVREDPSEKKEIDLCNLRFLYQGHGPSSSSYGSLPYRPGLLTLVR